MGNRKCVILTKPKIQAAQIFPTFYFYFVWCEWY
uniref:Uncharacterized protein n=1 Tax=Anguilla anguilla TaxID=7936 RepID=A0A0E9WD80_ANGAN